MTVDLVTPSRKIADNVDTKFVRIPGVLGEMRILPGHTELLTQLGTGVLSFEQNGKERKFAVSYGFAEVAEDKVVVLAEMAEESHEIDIERAKAAQQKAQEQLAGKLGPGEFQKFQAKLERSLIRQHVGSQ